MSNPPTPTVIKAAFGNPGKRPMNQNEPTPPVGAKMPEHLSPDAQKEWQRLAPMLESAGLLTEIDADALEMYCEAYSRWRAANKEIARFGIVVRGARTNFPVQSPYVALSNAAFKQMKTLLGEFGMTPSSRTRVSKAPTAKVSRLGRALGGGT